MILIAILIPIVTLIVKLVTNYKKWLHSPIIKVKHSKEWLIMAACNIPAIIIFTINSSLIWYWAALLSGLMIAFFIWLFFDGIYNLLRGYGIFFTGSDDKDDATTDNFLQAIPLWLHVFIKVGGLALFTLLYLFL